MKYGKIIILIIVATLAGVGILKAGLNTQEQIGELTKHPDVEIKRSDVEVKKQVKLVINKEEPIEKNVKIKAGEAVFDLLKKSGVEFNYENYESGAFIISIEGISEPTKNWIYYVNGKMGNKAVDERILKKGDVVKFKHQRSPF